MAHSKQFLLFFTLAFSAVLLSSCGDEGSSSSTGIEITSISPDSGAVGTRVRVTAHGVDPQPADNRLTFNGTPATIQSVTPNSLTTTVPEGASSGSVSLQVAGHTAEGPYFTVLTEGPVIDAVTPDRGGVGTRVTLTGDHFLPASIMAEADGDSTAQEAMTKVGDSLQTDISGVTLEAGAVPTTSINGLPVSVSFGQTLAPLLSLSNTEIIVEVPEDATGGIITLIVGDKTATSSSFTLIRPPAISEVNPTAGPAGSEVTISGHHFAPHPDSNQVMFNGTRAQITSTDSTRLVVTVPGEATTGLIEVITNGQATTGPTFTVTEAPVPQVSISNIAPKSGPVGTEVTINGKNFGSNKSDNTVTFNGTKATLTSTSKTELVATVPKGATNGPVKVTANVQTAAGPSFTVTQDPDKQLAIDDISPKEGPVGTIVTITGANFSATASGNTVSFNGTSASVSSASTTELTVSVPQGATTGSVNVHVGNQTAEGPTFTVTETPVPQVTIDDISPKQGPVGTEVTINGQNFSATKAQNTVTFNGSEATVSSASTTKLVVAVPDKATDGPVKVQVGNQTASGPNFNVTQNHAPAITGSKTAFTVQENSTAVATITATDPDGDALTYAISGGADADKFTITPNSGKLAFKTAPDFENPGDTGGNNGYEVVVQASDGTLSDSQALTVKVTYAVGPITFTIEENTTAVATITATDPNGDALTYSISGGADADAFTISNSGKLAFKTAPDFENPGDTGGDNMYEVELQANDGALINSQTLTVKVTDAVGPITFDGGRILLDSGPIYDADSPDFVFEAVSEDTDLGNVRRKISIFAEAVERNLDESGSNLAVQVTGPDASFFRFINGSIDVLPPGLKDIDFDLEFTGAAPDYENPADAGADNTYKFTVTITDTRNGDAFSQEFTIPISDVQENRPPTITSPASFTVEENRTDIGTITATDPDGDALTYIISGGADADQFTIEPNSGVLTLSPISTTPDFENPFDANYDNVYEVTVTVSDGTKSASQDLSITVTNINEAPEFFRSRILSDGNIYYYAYGPDFVYEAVPEGTDLSNVLKFGILLSEYADPVTNVTFGGPDGTGFSVKSIDQDGHLINLSGPTLEYSHNAGGTPHQYQFTITAENAAGQTATQTFTIPVAPSN